MMGLSATLNIAQSALATNAALSSLVSRNIAGVNDTSYTRKIANIASVANGTGSIVSVSRATNTALFGNLLSSTSESAAASAVSDGLDQLEQTVSLASSTDDSSTSTTTAGTSPAVLIGKLDDALQQYSASPSDSTTGQAVLTAAKTLAGALNSASTTIQGVRTQADKDIASAVADVNSLLGQFKTVNDAIVKGTASGTDTTDLQDQRNALLVSMSSDLGISTTASADGGMAIYTDSGVTLFQGSGRTVSFTPTTTYADGTVGNAVSIDGVPVTGSSAVMGLKSGSIAGLTQLRDTAAVAYQNQLDQIASGLVSAFAETDQTGGSAPTIPGLFTYSGSPAMPTASQTGTAASVSVSANVDPSQGGTLTRLRDGGIGDPGNAAYVANTTGAASYTTHIDALVSSLASSRSFDAASGGAAQGSLTDYATSSVSWLEATRQSATDTASAKSAVATQTSSALSSATGVNLDDQLSLMLNLEHSYQSSAELMSTVNGMFTALFSAIQ
jgi:flagellar hook-associated protein 1